jgi:hypothetical protein
MGTTTQQAGRHRPGSAPTLRVIARRAGGLCRSGCLHTTQEFVEACLAETSPGAFVDLTNLPPPVRRGHPVLRAVPGHWWTWVLQLLLPNQGPAVTSLVTVEEALVVLTAAMLLHTLGMVEHGGTQGNPPIPAPVVRALLRWTQPAPQTGSPAAARPSDRLEEDDGDEFSAAHGRGGSTGPCGL